MPDTATDQGPTFDREFRCSPWTLAQGVDPIGSAGRLDHLLLVEWPLPWPSDVGLIYPLAEAASDPRARVMTVVPRADEDGRARITHHRRVGTSRLVGVDHRVEAAEVPALLMALLEDLESPHLDWPSAVGEAPAEVLVCAHGRRDPCCGRFGTLLEMELAAEDHGVRVSRCSHTGGHRYAPTAITLPEGRAWAYADAPLLLDVLARRGDLRTALSHDRGNLAFDPWAQVVERAVFQELGWAWLDHEVTEVEQMVAEDGRSAQVRLRWVTLGDGTGSATADVRVRRALPVLVCGSPPEAATKTSPELELLACDISS